MPRIASEAQRDQERQQAATLTRHYRAIGPAAIAAALACAPKKTISDVPPLEPVELPARRVNRAA